MSTVVDFSKYFLEHILQSSENDESITVIDFRAEKACEKGENFMSIVTKIVLKAKRKETDFIMSLIIKQPHKSLRTREIFLSDKMFKNEIIAYNLILPALQEFYRIQLPVAKCFFADNNCIVLEDLCVCNYEMNRTETTLNNEKCSVVLKELAVIHAASIILKERDLQRFEYLSKQVDHAFQNNKAIAKFVYISFKTTLQLLHSLDQSDEIKKAINIMEHLSCDIYQRISDLIIAKSADQTAILNHGDCWRNNILFRTLATGKVNVKFIDLQNMTATSPALDISYFLYIHMTPENRHQNIDLLLDEYINSLHRILTEHGLQKLNKIYTKSWLKKEMSDFEIFGLTCSVWVTPVFYLDKNNVPDMNSINWDEYDNENLLQHITPDLKDRTISTVLDFIKSYNL